MATIERLFTALLMSAALVWTLLCVASLAGLGELQHGIGKLARMAQAEARTTSTARTSPIALPGVEIVARRSTAVASRPLPMVE